MARALLDFSTATQHSSPKFDADFDVAVASGKILLSIAIAIGIGVLLRFVVNLDPIWWLAWFVPGLLFALALRQDGWTSRGLVAIAAMIGATANLAYLLNVMPLAAVLTIMMLQTLLWMLIIGSARRFVKAFDSAWTMLALPVIAVAADTLLAHFTPDGNWGSLAYTQMKVLPVAQLASLFGVGGILFVLMLVNSAVAFALIYGVRLRHALPMYGAVGVLMGLSIWFGWARLQTPDAGTTVSFGVASVDDYIAVPTSDAARNVWARYSAQVEQLAGSGAKFVVLPEKIDVLSSKDAEIRKQRLAALARDNHVWLVVGLGVDTGTERRNEAWWFAPDGRLATNYLKHFLAPPEREYVTGSEYPVNEIEGVKYGVAICKDMHFARLAREFATREAAVMLVPAWDFNDDAWMAAEMTALRGVENGFAIVRSSRNGLLSISDAYGRLLAVHVSTKLPGTTLFETVKVGKRVSTLYARSGDLLGWLCVAAGALIFALTLLRVRLV
jgi:apolipoprotein N-acyltransferase